MGMSRSGIAFWLDRPPEVNLQAARRLLLMLGALAGERLSARGKKWRQWVTIRAAAMLVNADEGDNAATAAMLAAIAEDPPRGGTDLSGLFSRRQPGWQQRSQQL